MKNAFFFFILLLFVSTTQGQFNPETVTIGTQVWMKTNLDVSTYRNGDPIPEVKDSVTWANLTTGAWCYYNNDPENGKTYGKLYNWYAVNDPRGLAPEGWHIPGNKEWNTLILWIDPSADTTELIPVSTSAGGAMKEPGTIYWLDPNQDATNSSGFTGLPGGVRGYERGFASIGKACSLWSITENDIATAWIYGILSRSGNISRFYTNKHSGFYIRCVKN